MSTDIKKKVLDILQDDCRVSVDQIALMLGQNPDTIQTLIDELEQERIIVKYPAMINWDRFDDDLVTAMIDVKVLPQRNVGFDQVAERIYNFPEVRSVALMSGGYDLSVIIEGKSMKEVALFVAQKLAVLEHVQSTATHFVLKRYKHDGVILDKQEEDHRLVVSP
ncbi:Lrp/AsnC family transcriptional regulator [Heliophilum fasciatum]|uniref:DNA-binding Lrp family transcriptional regulator n=1 Tax=Heliophilum fasciatum TaxID=35700 RepID=A0A4R2RFD9_9FIRM|nr:Lrp/AsnC family transcriptional regulator [Heliophilum fasciatum]MCW2279160.1 DNA-binding Lrp family transcriptional regulator [Heliophilum fasciatum]TCP61019.1 DNA-binding Lrp family transcriptional regulator [Heliophilum fasciatum]